MNISAKLDLIEKLIREIKMEMNTVDKDNMEAEDKEAEMLYELKLLWNLGLRNPRSKTGKFFRATDVCRNADEALIRQITDLLGENKYSLLQNIGVVLTKLSGKTFIHEKVEYVMERYNVDSTAAYRFVETE